MRRDYIEFQDRSVPLAFLITFRTYGTWLHGDERGSMDRREYNRYGDPKIAASQNTETRDRKLLKSPPFLLHSEARTAVDQSIREVCSVRHYYLFAINVRTNHAHVVVSAAGKPESVMTTFKAYATRRLRRDGLVDEGVNLWSRHGSTRYLWTERHIETAVEYVVMGQGGELPRFE